MDSEEEKKEPIDEQEEKVSGNDVEKQVVEDKKFESMNDFKPRKWLLIILILIAIAISVVLINKGLEILKEKKEEIKSNDIFDNSSFFNADFEINNGTQSAAVTKDLLDDVVTSNKKNKNHLITIVYNDYNTSNPDEIVQIKNEITSNKKYEISLDYDNNKYVNKITIVGSVDKDSIELKRFNGTFEMYTGSKNGILVSSLLDRVITNNKKEESHLVSVVYGSHNTTDPNEITNIKKEFEDWHNYEVSLDYNDDGYVSTVTIK